MSISKTFLVTVHCRDENEPTLVDADTVAYAVASNFSPKDVADVTVQDQDNKEVAGAKP